ncbi:MAG: hypothetical protein IJ786_04485 [Bacteroidaceae bacterium]|nr:hypothetical protein [Bacteroidaceae bacterium]
MKKISYLMIVMLSLFMTVNVFTACSDDDGDDSTLVIRNSSSYSLQNFTVVFVNSHDEIVKTFPKGTFNPSETLTFPIPEGATEWWMGGNFDGGTHVSPNYEVSIKSLNIDNGLLRAWY